MDCPPPDQEGLRRCLEAATAPLWESALFGAAWPSERQTDWTPLELFQRHFSLFSTLYELADGYLAQGLYLHVHFMRTRLLPLPPDGRCAHYEADAGFFCGLPSPCAFHPTTSLPEAADSRGFYRNPANIDWMDEGDAERVIKGAWQLLASWPKAEAAWRTLGLPAGSRPERVRQRYRELARRLHPDTRDEALTFTASVDGDFCKVHEAFRLLSELFPLTSAPAEPATR